MAQRHNGMSPFLRNRRVYRQAAIVLPKEEVRSV
jgi:hypothetical protein